MKKVRQSINKAWLKVKPNRSDIDCFKRNLIQLIDRINENESEEHHKKLVSDFLEETYYRGNHYINTKGRNDQVIHNGKEPESTVGVIIEAKKPTNKSEMLSKENINTKAFQELMLYYLRERITHNNLGIKHLMATNMYEWFVFDANTFEKAFAKNKKLLKQFEDFEAGRLSGTTTDFFYKEIAQPFIEEVKDSIEYTWFDIRTYDKPLRNNNKKDDAKLIALYKFFSPEHLLKLPFANDSNSLDNRFYKELLHLIGLEEVKDGGKKVIQRPKKEDRNSASLLENTIDHLESRDKLSRLSNSASFGATKEERLFNVGLELCITWVNRILFLKLLEAQLISYHKGNAEFSFLNMKFIKDYDELDTLFFEVLAVKVEQRDRERLKRFLHVPYLNSSLFEPTDLEHDTLFISNLADNRSLPIISGTVLKGEKGKKRSGELSALEYLFAFLDAYDFSSEGGEDIQEDNKTLINASVLGLIFEKINGYKDGSFFTPGFITMYMCRETIRRAVVQKFNEEKGWTCESLDDVYDKIEDRSEANDIINSLKICDPAVGSGHFLVSALNEILSIKHDLRVLQDREGRRLKEYELVVENDELIVTDEEGALFEYHPESKESQRVQETLFHEKQTIIENCLFGVDINPNSVKICRLRLWIELLKHAYYKSGSTEEVIPQLLPGSGAQSKLQISDQVWGDDVNKNGKGRHLETLPNIDINIKTGNSLISRFALDADLKEALKKSKWSIDSYRAAVQSYRNARNKDEKREMIRLIDDIKGDFRTEILRTDKNVVKLKKLSDELVVHTTQTSMFDQTAKEKKEWKKTTEKLTKAIAKLEADIEEIKNNKIFENAFEWRFEFPEVLNEQGDFVGFDVVIANPPYVPLESFENIERNYFRNNYSFIERKFETSILFLLNAFKFLKNEGLVTFIAPVTWETGENYKLLRDFLFNKKSIDSIINLPFNIFEDAYVETGIFSFSNRNSNGYSIYNFDKKAKIDDLDEIPFTRISDNLISKPDYKIVFDPVWASIVQRYKNEEFVTLGDVTISTQGLSGSRFKLVDNETEVYEYPFLNKGQVYNYILSIQDLKYTSLEGKSNLLKFYQPEPKLLIRRIVNRRNRIDVGYTDKKIVFKKDINPFVIKHDEYLPKYVLGIMASKFISSLYINTSSIATKDDFRQTTLTELRSIPIPKIGINEQKKVAGIASTILSLKKENPQANTSKLEAEIDQMVYELYGLSEEEIAIVEGSVG
jgi:adenine-specific DNA-methyltransferase